MGFFNMDGPVFSFLSTMADLIILNIIFLISCIPIFTFGAALTSLYSVTLKMAHNEESYIYRSYIRAFKSNFKKSTFAWLLALLIIFFLIADIRIFSADNRYSLFIIGAYLMLIITGMALLFFFPLTAKFENTIKNTLKNSFLMEIKHLPFTFLILIITMVPAVISASLPLSYGFVYILWILFGFSLTALINSYIFEYFIFNHYIDSGEKE